ncbi:MAG: 5-aminolevulinate synthase [Holosporales bacterium]
MNYEGAFESCLGQIKQENRYREFVTLSRMVGNLPYALWHNNGKEQEVIVWCSNDYLGMSHHPQVLQAFKDAAVTYGVGSGGTRNISGTTHPHVLLEKTMADLHKKEAALLFSSGYAANEGTLSVLCKIFKNLHVFSDEKNHASIIQGLRHAQKHIFKHNDVADLQKALQAAPADAPKLIVVESIYSMSGNIAPLKEICALAKEFNSLLYVDEVHAMGVYGPKGAGLVAQFELEDHVDIVQGNFAKGYGVVGGYIAASALIVDCIRSSASSFIFTTSLPPAVSMAILTCVNHLSKSDSERCTLWNNVQLLKQLLINEHIPVLSNSGHIIPILVGDPLKCKQLSRRLLHEFGIYVQPINYPTVPRGEEMLRITVTTYHTHEMIYELVQALRSLWNQDVEAA